MIGLVKKVDIGFKNGDETQSIRTNEPRCIVWLWMRVCHLR